MKKAYTIVQMAGAVLLLAGAMLQITRWGMAPVIYTLGAVMFAYVQVMSRYEGNNLIIRRLRRQHPRSSGSSNGWGGRPQCSHR